MIAAPVEQGRTFLESEAQPGQFVALITDRYWRDTLGSASVLGYAARDRRSTSHDRRGPLAVVRRAVHRRADLHAALREPRAAAARAAAFGGDLRRAGAGRVARAGPRRARHDLQADVPGVSASHSGWVLGAQTAREWQYGSMRAPLLMLFAATAFVLLIACVNIANLTSAQAIARAGELSLRMALGASQRDVVRFHLAELLIVCASGLVPGLLLARRPFRRCWQSIRRSPGRLAMCRSTGGFRRSAPWSRS